MYGMSFTPGETVQTPQGPALFSHATFNGMVVVYREDMGRFSVSAEDVGPFIDRSMWA